MKISYDPGVDALTIRFVKECVECEVIRLNDQVVVDVGSGERIVAIEVLDAGELISGLKERGAIWKTPTPTILNSYAGSTASVRGWRSGPMRRGCGWRVDWIYWLRRKGVKIEWNEKRGGL